MLVDANIKVPKLHAPCQYEGFILYSIATNTNRVVHELEMTSYDSTNITCGEEIINEPRNLWFCSTYINLRKEVLCSQKTNEASFLVSISGHLGKSCTKNKDKNIPS